MVDFKHGYPIAQDPKASQIACKVTVPLVLLVLFFQRHIIEGLTQGGVKE